MSKSVPCIAPHRSHIGGLEYVYVFSISGLGRLGVIHTIHTMGVNLSMGLPVTQKFCLVI